MADYKKFTIVMKNGIAYDIKVDGKEDLQSFLKNIIVNMNVGHCTTFDLYDTTNGASKVAIFHSEISSIEYD